MLNNMNFKKALHYHKLQLSTALHLKENIAQQANAYANLGDYQTAIANHEHNLMLAQRAQNAITEMRALSSLGRAHRGLGNLTHALQYFLQQLKLANYYEPSLVCLQKALPLFEHMRQNVGSFDHGTKQTLELYPLLSQTLINVLVRLNKVEEALEAAEMEHNRATTDALRCSVACSRATHRPAASRRPSTPCAVPCSSLCGIYIWLLHPKSGIVQFQKVDMSEFGLPSSDSASVFSESSSSYVQPLVETVASLRESLGVQHCSSRLAAKSMSSSISDELDSGE